MQLLEQQFPCTHISPPFPTLSSVLWEFHDVVDFKENVWAFLYRYIGPIQGGPKSKPPPILKNRINQDCQRDYISPKS